MRLNTGPGVLQRLRAYGRHLQAGLAGNALLHSDHAALDQDAVGWAQQLVRPQELGPHRAPQVDCAPHLSSRAPVCEGCNRQVPGIRGV